ncbi:MAG: flagellar basal-body rod protein FlgF [Nitrospirae bacterium]|nr:flagellar basal-body rod protein FlgF [Candidatus Manganitrophaceae bacterium]
MDSVYPVLSGALAQEKRLEVITNNLANINTAGFKKDQPLFEGMGLPPGPNGGPGGGMTPSPTFEMLQRISTDFSPGSIRTTGEPLDLAVDGEGFFAVQTPRGIRYTRGGSFTIDAQGQLTTHDGFPLLGSGGPITVPPGVVQVDTEGRISVKGTEVGAQSTDIDTLPLYRFSDRSQLKKVGQTLFETPGGNATPFSEGRISQGALEESNVNPVEEMVSMITVMRLYESAQKAIQTADEVATKASNEVGRLG